ncbi:MAG: acyl-CoA dehydrogenase family protein [Comamonadaceae bacterium]|jgi:acyl-CoA dehydrogenase|uniref:acyl-CoA dehydrogenase family protein n=1 Tax=Candidatus Skiveiella danica TaxID=3386177 RepID=UPI0009D1317D|nr:acyl-CoA dehydrogenase family protein [Comamonadaceae bacterium]MBK8357805.1 acyl-CoA dehydrogenase family protein [Comamonadaceae bacterium]MBK9988758.1 acyl-CoA dehydrogenase family protein [Betaproteobacteria bacterium]MBP8101622.1 acyl-CoA dehydrogenase family protein [Burkholderiaceae bacterium]OQC05526.1 MAG: (R)-benzylsuccinyl-CoA dehydrogenase [Alphaproteobacteria bacterium ADurb.Bin100]
MDFAFSPRVQDLQAQVQRFMDDLVLPSNRDWQRYADAGYYPSDVVEPLKAQARAAGLWNLFLPDLRDDEPGMRLSNMEYAPLAEIMGRVPWASEVFNCSAPDTGNIELLHLAATPEQARQWMAPLLEGAIRSCFAMSEPDVASSDATNICTRIQRDGDDYVINGRKWFITGALHPACRLAIVMGVSNDAPDAPAHQRHSMILVPMDAPGVEIVRNMPVMAHLAIDGHCEMVFKNVRVPAAHLLGTEGGGFALAQARLGPGRVHHCMRTIGQCELALELMCERALERMAFGRHLSDFANVQDWIGHSRVEIDQARLLVLRAAWLMDQQGNAAARVDVSAIKLVAAQLQTRVLDRAMQIFGAIGLTPDTPLAALWSWGRALRFLDGPDEVHLRTVARHELARTKTHLGANVLHLNRWMPPDAVSDLG